MGVYGLGYLALHVSDIAAWRRMAEDVFGMEVLPRADGGLDLRLDERRQRFSLIPAAQDSIQAIGWEVATRDELEQIIQSLRNEGVAVTQAGEDLRRERAVVDLYAFTDPMGFHVELFYGAMVPRTPYKPTLPISGYNTGNLGLGHIVVVAADPKAAIDFYIRHLGFRISDYIVWDDKDATFLHCNPRHHSLAIMNEFGPFKHGAFNHVMLEAKSMDDVGYAYDVVRDQNYPLIMEFGRHTNDHTCSFYIVTPSGFGIEYGFGGRLIGEDWEVSTYDAPAKWGHRMPQVVG